MPLVIGSLDEYTTVCCRCGCALKEEEVGGTMEGIFHDLEKQILYSKSTIVFCIECKNTTRKYANDPVGRAWARMQPLEHT